MFTDQGKDPAADDLHFIARAFLKLFSRPDTVNKRCHRRQSPMMRAGTRAGVLSMPTLLPTAGGSVPVARESTTRSISGSVSVRAASFSQNPPPASSERRQPGAEQKPSSDRTVIYILRLRSRRSCLPMSFRSGTRRKKGYRMSWPQEPGLRDARDGKRNGKTNHRESDSGQVRDQEIHE